MALPTKPTTAVPTWATDTNYASGADMGLSTKVPPDSGEQASGHERGKRPPARKINWLKHWICQWLAWAESALDSVDARLGNGTYAPTLTNPQDISSESANTAWYQRVGDVVTVTTRISYTSGAVGLKAVTIDLPLDPGANFANAYELIGSAIAHDGVESDDSGAGYVRGIVGTKTARIVWTTNTGTGSDDLSVQFSYRVA